MPVSVNNIPLGQNMAINYPIQIEQSISVVKFTLYSIHKVTDVSTAYAKIRAQMFLDQSEEKEDNNEGGKCSITFLLLHLNA